jgi:hypothetical protein
MYVNWYMLLGFQKLYVGLKGHPPLVDGIMYNNVKMEESTWCIQDQKIILINMEKVCIQHLGYTSEFRNNK